MQHIAISSAVLNSKLQEELPKVLPAEEAAKVIASSVYVHVGLPAEYLETTLHVYVQSLQMIWYVLIPMSGLGFIASLFVKHHSIHSQRLALEKANTQQQAEEKEEVVAVNIPDENQKELEAVQGEEDSTNEKNLKKTEGEAVSAK